MVPKIADFGLSRCFDEKQTQACYYVKTARIYPSWFELSSTRQHISSATSSETREVLIMCLPDPTPIAQITGRKEIQACAHNNNSTCR